MLTRYAAISIRHPRRIVALALLYFAVAGVLGGPAAGLLRARNGFEDPASQAALARKHVEQATGVEPTAGVIALVRGGPASAAASSAAAMLRADFGIARVDRGAPGSPLVARDGRSTVIAAVLRSRVDSNDVVRRLTRALHARHDVQLGGGAVATYQVGQQATKDLGFAELLAFPLLALLALVIFRGGAALLPLAGGMLNVFGAFLLLRAINTVYPLSSFALHLVIGLGLGLALDYSLFMVTRFREQLGRGDDVPRALRTTMATAGRTVMFSALTVAAAMAALIVFPQRFLQSMGIGGAVVALVAAAVSLSVLPALFVLFGRRIGRHTPSPEARCVWYRWAHGGGCRLGIIAASVAAVMVLAALPALRAHWTGVDASVLPRSQSARVVSDTLASDFPKVESSPMVMVASAPPGAAAQIAAYAASVRAVPGVTAVGAPQLRASGVWQVDANVRGLGIEPAAQRAVTSVRALPAPFPVAVGGEAASFHDQQAAIASSLPLAMAILVVSTLVILWLMTGSVILPCKALVMNALTVGVATGLLVLVFQDGRLTGPLAYTSQGGIESTDFLVLAAIVFALSTDYGVFLLTRIKEARDEGRNDGEAVAAGLQRTGAVVTAASVLLAVAIGAFATSKVVFLKEVGLGAAAGVLIDAFLVRALLVPALMGLLGRWNWWAPAPLRALHRRIGISERGVAGRPLPPGSPRAA
ncbi:MAG: MMPL family transporter [Thermoleophilaceae bacterium]